MLMDLLHVIIKHSAFLLLWNVDSFASFDARLAQTLAMAESVQGQL